MILVFFIYRSFNKNLTKKEINLLFIFLLVQKNESKKGHFFMMSFYIVL